MNDALPRVVGGITAMAPDFDVVNVLDTLWLAATSPAAAAPPPPAVSAASPSPRPPPRTTVPPAPARDVTPVRRAAATASPYRTGEPGEVTRLRTPAGRALPRRLDYERALRPFKRLWPAGCRQTFDIDATSAAYARTGILIPLFKPAGERWFDVDVVADGTPGMRIWDDTVAEFLEILRRVGAFRGARRWELSDDDGDLRLHDRLRRRTVSPKLLRSPHARRLILVVSDGRAPGWRDPALWGQLREWAKSTPTVVVNPLPNRLWRYSVHGLRQVRVGPGATGTPNTGLAYAHALPLSHLDDSSGPAARRWVPIPTVGLVTGALAAWASMLMRGDPTGCTAVLSAADLPEADDETGDVPRRPVDPVLAFRRYASAAAVRLAVLCSPYTSANLAVVHLIRQRLVPEATVSDVAELLDSGLFEAADLAAGSLVFRPGVQESLTALLARDDAWRTHEVLAGRIADRLEGLATFRTAPGVGRTLPDELIPFAEASRDTLRLLGVIPSDTESASSLFLPALDGATTGSGPGLARAVIEAPVFVVEHEEPGGTTLVRSLGADGRRSSVTVAGREVGLWVRDVSVLTQDPAPAPFLVRPSAVYLLHDDVADGLLRDGWFAALGEIGRIVVATPAGDRSWTLENWSRPGVRSGRRHVAGSAGLARAVAELVLTLPAARHALTPAAADVRRDLRVEHPFVRYDRYAAIARRRGLSAAQAAVLVRSLTEMGQVLHVGGYTGEDVIVLDHDWLVRGLTATLTDEQAARSGGILPHRRLAGLWSSPPDAEPVLLTLSESAGITHRLPGGDRSLVPARLPVARPHPPWTVDAEAVAASARIRIGRAEPRLIIVLISRHVGGLAVAVWREGMFLRDRRVDGVTEALVEAHGDQEIVVEARGRAPESLLESLLESVGTVIRHRWPTLTYEIGERSTTSIGPAAEVAGVPRRYYFYLSHARRPDDGDGDYWVQKFFTDLAARVDAVAAAGRSGKVGFLGSPASSEPGELSRFAGPLGGTEVFVMLCCEEYRSGVLSMAELAAFRGRPGVADGPDGPGHLLPVLWSPTSARTIADLGDPFGWAGDSPEYRQFGLKTLCGIGSYDAQYRNVLDRLARRIVEAAESTPIGPSRVRLEPEPVEVKQAFTVAIVAPAEVEGRPGAAYGPASERWRPFGVAAAARAAEAAGRLGLPARVDGSTVDRGTFPEGPGIVLLDPWILGTPAGAASLDLLTSGLQLWHEVLVVADRNDARQADFLRRIRQAVQPTRAVVRIAAGADELEELIRAAVGGAWRRYLRWGPVFPPAGDGESAATTRGRF